jgi:hypothetical protein
MRNEHEKNFFVLLAITFALVACSIGTNTSNRSISSNPIEWSIYNEASFSVELPAGWVEEKSTDEQVIHAVSDGTASLWIKSWPFIPSLVAKSVREWVAGNADAALLDESGAPERTHLELTLTENGDVLRLSSLLIYCDAKAYEVTGVTTENNLNRYVEIFQQAQDSAYCDPAERYPQLDTGALGMVIIPPAVNGESFEPAAYQESLALARKSGVQVSHYYFHWGDYEIEPGIYDWTIPDYIVEANALEGFQLSIVVSIIHTTVRGRIPDDLVGLSFDDPVFVQRLSAFLSAFAERYAGNLHYLSIGNEVNNYFANHRDQIPAYTSVFEETREAIHAVNPDLPVGIIFAYHDAETLNTTDIIQQLNLGDYVAYTIYLYNQGFHFRRDPAEIDPNLDRMIALAEGTPVVITETGWSTASELEGSEEGQAAYVVELFSALSKRRQDLRFVSWFVLHDPLRSTCEEDALTFFEPGTEPDPESMRAFETFICYFGLRQSNGTPKPAWEVWLQQVEEYFN